VVAADSPIKQLQDLQGRKLAIAGGELDKNSLLLQALMQKQGQADFAIFITCTR
jgi:NitT/TauT family transport system substrate-binding protein